MRYWFVNQGSSYEEEKNGNFIYAPATNSRGTTFAHWLAVKEVKNGDIILCNKDGKIRALGLAQSDGYDSLIPDSIKGQWDKNGYKADIEYYELENPLKFSDYKDEYMIDIAFDKNPFTVNGTAKMGYLFPIEEKNARLLINNIKDSKIKELFNEDESDFMNELEEKQEEENHFEEINKGVIKSYNYEELKIIESREYKYIPKYEEGTRRKLREKTDPKLKATRMELANYKCEINKEHRTFTCSSGKHQYLECHHIIPLNSQSDFPNIKLDSMFNLIAICPICHSQVHYATQSEKAKIFSMMYELRKEEMLDKGINYAIINEIFKRYY